MADSRISCLKPVNPDGDLYNVVLQEYSFPSGHASNSIAVYGTIFKNVKNIALRVVLVLVILLVGVSRFALGVHYPSDVLAGWIVALLAIWIYHLIEDRLGRYRTFILLDIIGIAGFFIAKTNDFYTGYGLLLGSTFGIMFEEKYVNFPETRRVLRCVIRVGLGVALFLAVNTVLKLPFSKEFLDSGTTAAFIVRSVRYAINMFLLLGVYPMSFRFFDRIGGKKNADTPAAGE